MAEVTRRHGKKTKMGTAEPVAETAIRKPGRWMLMMPDKATPHIVGGRHILVDSGLDGFARVLGARYLLTKGVSLDDADLVQVVSWKPNGWLPEKVIIIGASPGGSFTETILDLEDPDR